MRSPMKRGFTLIELLVVIAIIAILASILFPVFAKAREKARQAQCTSNVKQLALAIQMYSQDNNSQLPGNDGTGWVSKIAPYLGNSTQMFQCPSDTSGDANIVSYAVSGLLLRQDRTGVKESQIISPSEVGALADATPSQGYPSSRFIWGGGQQPLDQIGAELSNRHSKGAIVGFCDGHAKYYHNEFDFANAGNGAVRAMATMLTFGGIDNSVAGLPNGTAIGGTSMVNFGGEYAGRAMAMAAAKMNAGGYYVVNSFEGEKYTRSRPAVNYVWANASTAPGWTATTASAFDGVVVIVAKGSKIPGLGTYSNSTYVVGTATIKGLFEAGFQQNTVQVYTFDDNKASTGDYIKNVIGNGAGSVPYRPWGIDSIKVANDLEMVEKVGNDPYGIGYCSTQFADPDRVTILSLAGAGAGGADAVWPRSSSKFRWVMPPIGESDWPWKRSIQYNIAVGDVGSAATVQAALRTGALADALYNGPLFRFGIWPGNY